MRPMVKIRARARHQSGEMNGLESRYAAHLQMRQLTGQIASYRFEAVKLRLAKKTFLTVDFWVVMPDGHVELHEVKGFWEDDARVKTKVAAEMFHEFTFVGVSWDRRAGWQYEKFGERRDE